MFQSMYLLFVVCKCVFAENASSPILNSDFNFEIFEHSECDLLSCANSINEYNSLSSYYGYNRFYYPIGESICLNKKHQALTYDETISICMYTQDSTLISTVLTEGNGGFLSCYVDILYDAYLKLWVYAQTQDKYELKSSKYKLYAGISKYYFEKSGFKKNDECLLNEGDVFTFPSFSSTSSKKSVVYGFIDFNGLLITINTIGRNTKGIDIKSLSKYGSENEYLFPPNSKFKVISECKKKNNNKYFSVKVEEIDEPFQVYRNYKVDPSESEYRRTYQLCSKCNDDVYENCKRCEEKNKCSECYAGYSPDANGKCIKCKSTCLSCLSDNPEKCLTCPSGHGNINGECKACQENTCINCDNNIDVCVECKIGYLNENGRCVKALFYITPQITQKSCSDGCKNCTFDEYGNETCNECDYYYATFENGCRPCKFGCEKCTFDVHGNEQCVECIYYYGIFRDRCVVCSIGCGKCTFDENGKENCLECTTNSAFYNNKCKECSIDGCECKFDESGNEKCLSCHKGYYMKNDLCVKCFTDCIKCNETVCLKCEYGLQFDESKKICIQQITSSVKRFNLLYGIFFLFNLIFYTHKLNTN